MKPRDLWTWKLGFYHGLLPALRALGPARADEALSGLGRSSTSLWPPRCRKLAAALARVRVALPQADWDDDQLAPELAAGCLRFLARDYLLDTPDDAKALSLFDTTGEDSLREAIDAGRGAVLVGSHYGAHIGSFHWLYRRRVPLRLMVQRPRHVSRALNAFFNRDEIEPQSDFFLTRRMDAASCVSRILGVRSALRAGKAVYLPGDIPWTGPNVRPGRFLGQAHRMLSVWADLAAMTGSPVFHVFCEHRPGGRFALAFEPVGRIRPGGEQSAVDHYLSRLEASIAANPADAAAHLLWPCYGLAPAPAAAGFPARPSRRAAAIPSGG